jgi:hypothetical protein
VALFPASGSAVTVSPVPSYHTKLVLVGLVAPVVGSWMQVLKHSSTALRSRAMHPPPPSQGPPSEGRDWRGQAMEETMQLWTITELMHLTRQELCELASEIECELLYIEAGTVERCLALTSLNNIRRVMVLRNL